jgi:hypothetical protein
MINLQEFRNLVEEEKTDYKQFDMLVRAGLANKAQLQKIHRVLDKMKEDKPVLTSSDRAIVQELLNKMVDIVTSNKQIFQQTRRAVKEDTAIEEGVLDTADIKVSPSGRKVRAHRLKIGDVANMKEEFELVEAPIDFENDPPFVLVLKRRAIRMYPDKTKVALYYSKTLDKYFSVPYGGPMGAVVQAEETQIEEAVMDQLHKIVKEKQAQSVKFGNGQSQKVDHFTASAITQVHNALNDDNKKKFADMVHKSPAHLAKASDFAFSRAK